MQKVVFDLDGVLRDIISYLKIKYNIKEIKQWYWEHGGKDIYALIREDNYNALTKAKPTEYLRSIIKNFNYIEIWTNQPNDWLPYTNSWINNNITKYIDCGIRVMDSIKKEKKIYNEDIYIVEDYPNFNNYDNIILVDREYNKGVDCKYRVKTGDELIKKIKELDGNNRPLK
jgi:hypothetical protein